MAEPSPIPEPAAATPHEEDAGDRDRLHALEGSPGMLYAVLGGPVFWGLHITAMPAITPYICSSGQSFWYHAISVATLVAAAGAFLPAWRRWHADVGSGGMRFLGGVALLSTGISVLAILAEWAAVFFLSACAR